MNLKQKIHQIPKAYKILAISILVLAVVALISLKTNIPKNNLKQLNKPLIEEQDRLKKENEALLKQIKTDSVNYAIELEESKKKGEYFKSQYQRAKNLNHEYQKAFNSYRSGDFYNNFLLFSRFISGRDTLSIDRFDIDD
jgi:regulator of replication initiation timing